MFGGRSSNLVTWMRWRLAVSAPLAGMFLFHIYFGANQTVASLVMVLGLAACVLASGAAARGRLALSELGQHWPVALFAAVLPVLALWSLGPWGAASDMWSAVGVAHPPATLDRSGTLVEIVKFGGACSAFVLGFLATRRRDGGEIALRLLQAMGLAYALWAMSRYVGHKQLYHGGRLTGGFGSPNTAATLMAALAAISAGQMVAGLAVVGYGAERWLARVVLPGLIAMALMSGVALTGSRAGLVFGLAGCGLVLAFAAIDSQTRRARTPLLIGGVVVLALIIAGARLTQDRLEGAMDAASVRYGMLLPHWRAFEQHPLTGHGWGSFDALNQTLLPMAVNFNSAAQIRALHNAYLQTLVEVGVIGLAAFALIVGYVLIVAARRWSGLGARRALMVGTLAACLVFLAHAAFDYALQVPSMAAQWSWLLGVLLGFGTPTRGTNATKRRRPVMPPRQTHPNVKADGELVDA